MQCNSVYRGASLAPDQPMSQSVGESVYYKLICNFLMLLLISTFNNDLLFRVILARRIFHHITSNFEVSVCLKCFIYTSIWGVFHHDILCCDWKGNVPAQTVLRPHDPI